MYRSKTCGELRLANAGEVVTLAGWVQKARKMGGMTFVDLRDRYGITQIVFNVENNAELCDAANKLGREYVIQVKGQVAERSSKNANLPTGEIEIIAQELIVLNKSDVPPFTIEDNTDGGDDIRMTYRYLDLRRDCVRKNLELRHKMGFELRRYLNDRGFLEVETPILQGGASGAAAKPFITKHNALNKDFYLRIAPELALKEIIACGFDRVYEIGKNFRNEGMDPSHLQEFTVIEWYAAYWNYEDNIKFSTDLFQGLVQHIKGSLKFEYQGVELDFGNIRHINYCEELSKLIGSNILDFTDMENLKSVIKSKHLVDENELESAKSLPATIDLLFKKALRNSLIQPCIVYNYPACLVPLARRNDKDPRVIDMFQFVVNGWEMDKAYSELVDPITQREAFEEQARNRANGDEESFGVDEDFLLAMEHGMPPISGLGIGIDRLIALLTNQETLRDVIFFPMVK